MRGWVVNAVNNKILEGMGGVGHSAILSSSLDVFALGQKNLRNPNKPGCALPKPLPSSANFMFNRHRQRIPLGEILFPLSSRAK
jgi:hypothetical protein